MQHCVSSRWRMALSFAMEQTRLQHSPQSGPETTHAVTAVEGKGNMFQFAQNGRTLVEHRLVPTIHLLNFALNMQSFKPPWLRSESPDATTECKVSICASANDE